MWSLWLCRSQNRPPDWSTNQMSRLPSIAHAYREASQKFTFWNNLKHIPPPPNYIQSQQAQTASAMMVRQSMGLPGQYKMPLDPDYESDYDSDDDEDENPKDPYVNTCFCCCNLGIGVILGALFFLVSWIKFLLSYPN